MISSRLGTALVLAAVLAAGAGAAREAHAAAEVHRFNFVISAMPSQVDGGDFNGFIDFINQTQLTNRGLEGMKRVTFAWQYEGQLRYFVRPNIAVHAGVAQIRATTDREYLPQLTSAIQLHGEILSVPVHAGGAYYLAPYNQGDFQARLYFGAGVLSLVYNKALFQQAAEGVPEVPSLRLTATQDAPGYYAEGGAHMFFATRMSVMLGVVYRSARIQRMVNQDDGQPFLTPLGDPYTLDLTGLGGRVGLATGF